MDLNFLWPLLGGALGAAVVNSAFAFYKQKSDVRLEHDRWRRDQRQVEYANYLDALFAYTSAMTRARDGVLTGDEASNALADTQDAFDRAGQRIQLMTPHELVWCSDRVRVAAMDVMVSLPEQLTAEHDERRDQRWKDVNRPLVRAETDFLLLARHDLGMLEDNLSKTRAAVARRLQSVRIESGEWSP